MRIPRVFLAVLLIAVMAVAAAGCGGTTGVPQADYQALQTKLTTAQQSLTDSQAQVTKLQGDLSAAQAETASLQTQLKQATANQTSAADLAQLQQQYQDASARVDSLTSQLANVTATYNATKAQVDGYVAQIADLQQQIDQLSTATPTATPLPLTADNVKTAVWNRINNERAQAGLGQLQLGNNLQGYANQHVQQMASAHHTTTYTDAVVGVQAAYMAVGYLGVNELVDATFTFWQVTPSWYNSVILEPNVTYGAVAVLQAGNIFYISFMASNYP